MMPHILGQGRFFDDELWQNYHFSHHVVPQLLVQASRHNGSRTDKHIQDKKSQKVVPRIGSCHLDRTGRESDRMAADRMAADRTRTKRIAEMHELGRVETIRIEGPHGETDCQPTTLKGEPYTLYIIRIKAHFGLPCQLDASKTGHVEASQPIFVFWLFCRFPERF